MLYYSGFSRRIGDVDEGSTVTDFLPAERARGITIQSAAITFNWPPGTPPPTTSANTPRSSVPHNINLIDTPGHADFTFEVLRSLRVLDGAVCILDGVAGVEAQTEKVWAQAAAYAIPRLIFVNKLDRDGAAFARTISEIGSRLDVWPALCEIPWWDDQGKLIGIGDVVGLKGMLWKQGGDGKEITAFAAADLEKQDPKLSAELKKARVALVELLSEYDDEMVEKFLDVDEDHLAIASQDIIASLRKCALQHPQNVAPVFAGASFRNIGVQPLLDAVVDLLPSPIERPDPEMSINASAPKTTLSTFLSGAYSDKTSKALSKDKAKTAVQNISACALAFKVVADPRRGVLVYVRVYSGSLDRNVALWNTNLQLTERAPKLMRMYANDAVDIDSIQAGQIGVIPGLKHTRTGDTLIAYAGANPKTGPPGDARTMQLKPIDVPPPVFFVSVEPHSLSEERAVKESLESLLREDPSLHVSIDEESGQTHLAGMGELHLEIARDRLVQDLKAKARIGQIEIGYREAITTESGEVTETYDREVSGKSSMAACTVTVKPLDNSDDLEPKETNTFRLLDNNILTISTPTLEEDGSSSSPDNPGLPASLPIQTVLQSFQTGVSAALARGPTHTFPIHSTAIQITFDPQHHIFPNTTPAALSSAARLAVQKALRTSADLSATAMMEPVMNVAIAVDENSLGSVVHDISSARGGNVLSLDASEAESLTLPANANGPVVDVNRVYAPPDPFHSSAGADAAAAAGSQGGSGMRTVTARVPLKEMVGYLKHLRSLTGGRGTFTMAVDRFEKMGSQRMREVIKQMRGEFE
jgi:elongation factor G